MTAKNIYGVAPFIGENNKYHYVYRITNLIEQKHYYGVRSSVRPPFLDLGDTYWASPKQKSNKWIIKDQKTHRNNYKYKIIKCFSFRKDALDFEILLHAMFDVKSHKKFYNDQNQTSSGFDYDASGFKTMRNKITGEIKNYPVSFYSPELVHVAVGVNVGYVTVKDDCGNNFRVLKTDSRYISGDLIFISTGTVNVSDKFGNKFRVKTDDQRYISGELQIVTKGINKGYLVCKNINTGEIKRLQCDSTEITSGKYVPVQKDRVVIKTNDGCKSITKNEFDKGHYETATSGVVQAKLISSGERLLITQQEFNVNRHLYTFHTEGTVQVKTETGKIIRISKNDPRYISGELKSSQFGAKRSDEQKKNQSQSFKANSWKWISNEETKSSKRVKLQELDMFLKLNWFLGRKFK